MTIRKRICTVLNNAPIAIKIKVITTLDNKVIISGKTENAELTTTQLNIAKQTVMMKHYCTPDRGPWWLIG